MKKKWISLIIIISLIFNTYALQVLASSIDTESTGTIEVQLSSNEEEQTLSDTADEESSNEEEQTLSDTSDEESSNEEEQILPDTADEESSNEEEQTLPDTVDEESSNEEEQILSDTVDEESSNEEEQILPDTADEETSNEEEVTVVANGISMITSSVSITTGAVELTLPDTEDEDTKYDVTYNLVLYKDYNVIWNDTVLGLVESYEVTIYDSDGTQTTQSVEFTGAQSEDYNYILQGVVEGVSEGAIITLSKIKLGDDLYDSVKLDIEVENADEHETIDVTYIRTDELEAGVTNIATTEVLNETASVQVTTPETEVEGTTYDVELDLNLFTDGYSIWTKPTATYTCEVIIGDAEPVEETFEIIEENGYKLQLVLEEVPADTTVVISEIHLADNASFDSVKAEVVVSSNDVVEMVTIDSEDYDSTGLLALSIGDTVVVTSTVKRQSSITESTYESLGGEYNIGYLISNYNILSFGSLSAVHVIGPVIVQNDVWHNDDDGQQISLSDYSRGISSYIGVLEGIEIGGDTVSAANINYGYDSDFVIPFMYTAEYILDDEFADMVSSYTDSSGTQYIVLDDGTVFESPNASGDGIVLQNNDYFNFTYAQEIITDLSKELHEQGAIEGQRSDSEIIVIDFESGYNNVEGVTSTYYSISQINDEWTLTLTAGLSYQISNTQNLDAVNIEVPDEYTDGLKDSDIPQTTISFSDNTLQTTNEVEGDPTYDFHIFPNVYVDGKDWITNPGSGGEYSEGSDNMVIWNFPYQTGSMTFTGQKDIVGHIVAPNTSIQNIAITSTADNITWNGGNIDGCVIAQEVQLGSVEVHLWPYSYSGIIEDYNTEYTYKLDVWKTFEGGDLSEQTFEFKLELISAPKSYTEANTDFPIIVTADADGDVEFTKFTYTEVGTYIYQVSEVIPDDVGLIVYDKSVYTVTVEVTKDESNDESNNKLIGVVTVEKIVNLAGTEVEETLDSDYIEFFNEKLFYELPSTGGVGSANYFLVGITMIGLSFIACLFMKRKTRFSSNPG